MVYLQIYKYPFISSLYFVGKYGLVQIYVACFKYI